MSYLDGTQEKLYDLRNDPEQTRNIADERREVCETMHRRLWDEMGGDPPQYEVMREGHEWYEYPDIYDPTSDAPHKLLKRRRTAK